MGKKQPCDCPQEILDLLAKGRYEEAFRAMLEYQRKKK